MRFPPVTYNGNTVREYGRLLYQVTSNSRKGITHTVDLEESLDWKFKTICDCESWRYNTRPCRHILASFMAIATWCKVRQSIRSEWVERLRFLLTMGQSFREALQSPYLAELRNQPKPQIVRKYTLPNQKK